MATQLQIRRGTATQIAAFTGAEGEVVVNTTNDSIVVSDGSTAGGFEQARADLNNVSDASLNAALTGNTVSALTITTLTLGSTAITATGAELNILDGVTATAAELNILDGVTATTAELNILDGVTSTAAELNILDGVTATTAELNYVDGVTSAIQTQIDAKAPLASPTFTGTVTVPGLTTTANISFADNDKAIFGAGSDLQIYHNGSDSFISDQGTGRLNIQSATDLLFANTANTQNYIYAVEGGAVNLYYSGSKKFETTSTGIDVTGGMTITGNVGIGTSSLSGLLTAYKSQNGDPKLGHFYNDNTGTAAEAVVYITNSSSVADGLFLQAYGQNGTTAGGFVQDAAIIGSGTGASGGLSIMTRANADMRFYTNGHTNERMRIDASGDTTFKTSAGHLSVEALGSGSVKLNSNGSMGMNVAAGYSYEIDVGGSEVMRIDSSGNFCVGTTNPAPVSNNVQGVSIRSFGELQASRDNAATLFLNRKTSNGSIVVLRKDNTDVGYIRSRGSEFIAVGSGDTNLEFNFGSDQINPSSGTASRDNAIDLGSSGARFDDIFATNGTINTSDRNEKQDIEELSQAEKRVAVAAKGLLRKYRWKSAVAEKGDNARIHVGIIAQDLKAAFEAEGLDAARYGMWCSDTWTNDDGSEQTRLGVRYSELLAFIISAI